MPLVYDLVSGFAAFFTKHPSALQHSAFHPTFKPTFLCDIYPRPIDEYTSNSFLPSKSDYFCKERVANVKTRFLA